MLFQKKSGSNITIEIRIFLTLKPLLKTLQFQPERRYLNRDAWPFAPASLASEAIMLFRLAGHIGQVLVAVGRQLRISDRLHINFRGKNSSRSIAEGAFGLFRG